MALSPAGRKAAGAGFALIGITVWVVAAVGPTAAHPRVAFLGAILGGMLTMAGLALNFARRRRIRRRYFQETQEDAGGRRRTRQHAEPLSASRTQQRVEFRVALPSYAAALKVMEDT
jgi:hypothetical protein